MKPTISGAGGGDSGMNRKLSFAAVATVLASGIPRVGLEPTVYLENPWRAPLVPYLQREDVLDYPPLADNRRFSWTSWWDQAALAVAAFSRPALHGKTFEIATLGAVTGPELAKSLEPWLRRPVQYGSTTPEQFRARLLALTRSEFGSNAIAELDRGIHDLPPEDAIGDTASLEDLFGVKLAPIGRHIAGWKNVGSAI